MAKRASPSRMTTDVPCIYADDVANLSMDPGILRFYFTRNDPPPEDGAESVPHTVAQIVMPKAKFMEMLVFFRQSLSEFDLKGSLYDDELLRERLRAIDTPATDGAHDE